MSSHTSPSTLSIPSAVITTHVCFRIDEEEDNNNNEKIKSDDNDNNKNNNSKNIMNRLLFEDYRKNFSVYRDLLAIMSIREGNADTDLLVVNTADTGGAGGSGATASSYPTDNPSVFSPCWGDMDMNERGLRPSSAAASQGGAAGPTRVVSFRRRTVKKKKEEQQPKSPSSPQPSSRETTTTSLTHTNPSLPASVTEERGKNRNSGRGSCRHSK